MEIGGNDEAHKAEENGDNPSGHNLTESMGKTKHLLPIGASTMQPEQLQQIMGYYLEDANNHLKTIEQYLLNLQRTIENPEMVSDLFRAVRCGIVGGANLLPISNTHINSIHKTGLCLVDCFKVFQQQGALKVDQKLQDLLMQLFDTLKSLIEPLRESSGLPDDKTEQILSEVEQIRKAIMEHIQWLVMRSHSANSSDVPITPNPEDDLPSLDDLELVIDELSLDCFSDS